MKNIIFNKLSLWKNHIPFKKGCAHKYNYGLALIYAAPHLTGATRLAAEACARIGCGLTTVISPVEAAPIYKTSLPAHIIVQDNPSYHHDKCSARLIGSGGIMTDITLDMLSQHKITTIFDADALRADLLSFPLPYTAILTPHEGEFSRLFPDITGTNAEKAHIAAQQTGAYIVLKAAETVIAAPEEAAVYKNTHTSPVLATAGSGDALAGMITGLIAQNMPITKALCASVWMHGEIALRCGYGFVASDIEKNIPHILQNISSSTTR